jgi:hypothetical protein
MSPGAGSIALMDGSGEVVVDALVYGSQQSSSSASGTITSPELAVLEGDQSQGGCIVISPWTDRRFGRFASLGGQGDKSVGRFPDGADADSNCQDFLVQSGTTLTVEVAAEADNIKVASVAEFTDGQSIVVGSGADREPAVIKTVGTPGGAALRNPVAGGATEIPVTRADGFSAGQTITIGVGESVETAVVASIAGGGRGGFGGRRGGGQRAAIIVSEPLKSAHPAGAPVAGSGLTLAAPLARPHATGDPVADGASTPGAPNQYGNRRR